MIFTESQKERLVNYLSSHELSIGLGTEESTCSIGAINLAISGELTDDIPDCMSVIVGQWIDRIEDEMPDSIRNSDEWKSLIPLAAKTGRHSEKFRYEIVIDWMWNVLAAIQPIAERKGFGKQWAHMISKKTDVAADAAADAASGACAAAAHLAVAAIANFADDDGVIYTIYAVDAACVAAVYAIDDHANFWTQKINPCKVLKQLVSSSL